MKKFAAFAGLALALAACQDAPRLLEPSPQASLQPAFAVGGSDIIPGRFIVTLRDGESPATVAAAHAVRPDFVYTAALNGFAGAISEAARSGLLRDARVVRVEPDAIVRAWTTQSNATWGIDRIDQRELPLSGTYTYNTAGSGVTAYIIDTGIRLTHQEFGSRATSGFDAIDGGSADDCHGHGTHVAGTTGGTTYGVAKSVALVAVRVLDCSGSGTWSGVIAGVDWVTANATKPAVANMSLGGSGNSSVDDAVRNSINSGVSYAVAAGNGNIAGIAQDACNYSPARVAEAMTIGATTKTDAKASWSNYGDCVDWFAPGVSITSAWSTADDATNTISGTSMASPHTAGVAALYLEANPLATAQQVRDALYAATTKGIVTSSSTANNHLLYSLVAGSSTNSSPTSSFTYSCNGLTCGFTDTSTDSDGTITAWSWSFGDGVSSTAQNPSHTYAASGTYTVSLTVTDDGGATGTSSQSVTVSSTASAITLSATGYKVKGQQKADLTWSGTTATSVDIWRNGTLITTTVNDGFHTDHINNVGNGTYTYQVCEAGTATCSNEATVTFN
ncbi:MAG TPA: S8 family serine peptidase [Vicinamibacterales bacterium]|nr:S8 family serine peptidase [Vicinamibacterales bacterium]